MFSTIKRIKAFQGIKTIPQYNNDYTADGAWREIIKME